ncbi:hypothetical protein JCM11641_001844 [Rhodosporidiobolus odoratus]
MSTPNQATSDASATLEAQIASLHAVLTSLDRCRSSLPTLLQSISHPFASPDSRAQLYRTASHECTNSLRSLGEQLDSVETVLQATSASEAASSKGIVLKPRQRKPVDAWEQVGGILDLDGKGSGGSDREGKGREPYERQFASPTSPAELAELAEKWEGTHSRVSVRLVGAGGSGGGELREMRLTLRGVMRAIVAFRWTDGDEGPGRRIEVDLVSSFGLKEETPPYLPSRYSLFQHITNEAMTLVDRARIRRAQGAKDESVVEEVMAFLSDPPLPF